MVANGALDGLRVVELATLFAAPLIGTMLDSMVREGDNDPNN